MDRLILKGAVGPFKPNIPGDVSLVQRLLNKNSLANRTTLKVDGHFGRRTHAAIVLYQKNILAMDLADGVVDVFGLTIRTLQASSLTPLLAPLPVPIADGQKPGVLTDADYKKAAAALQCEVAAIKAVAMVETGTRGAFYAQGRPVILFERHYFSRLTNRDYDKTYPEISNRKPGGYGKFSEQYGKLDAAFKLDQDAALRSASWGAFQIMGDNYEAAGFTSAADFVAAMKRSMGDQLQAFVSFIKSDARLLQAIRDKNWAVFAAAYNGPDYKKNHYDTKLASAYAAANK